MSTKRNDAPGDLDVIRLFVNTHDLEDHADAIATPDALRAWLREHGLLEAGAAAASGAEVRRAQELREALRHMLLSNGGLEPDPLAAEIVDAVARRSRVGVRFQEGGAALEPEARGVDGALGRLVAIVATSMADGTWARLKACHADDCQWAFYDHTRNHSGRWCDMAVCGNRTKVRAFRARQTETEGAG